MSAPPARLPSGAPRPLSVPKQLRTEEPQS